MNNKKSLKQITILFILCALIILFPACRDNLQTPEQNNKAQVNIVIADNHSRTVFPNAAIAKYKLMGGNNGSAETELADFTTAGTTVNLAPGNWSFILNAYNAGGAIILQGSVQNKTISASGTNTVSFNLSPLNSGVGTVQITLQFPVSASITKITATSGIETKDFNIAASSGEFVYTKTDVAAGDYFVSFKLYSGSVLRSVVSEMVLVRGNLTSGKTITLVGADLKANGSGINVEIEMVQIPGGSFQMGSNSGYDNEKPVHTVTLSGFYMGKYEVTQEQWTAVMGNNPSYFTSAVSGESGTPGKLPVECVSWYDALVFCNKLSMTEGLNPAYSINGKTNPADWGTVPTSSDATWNAVVIVAGSTGYRLPTEAQWEYACRAGTTTAYNTGDTISDNTGWYKSNSGDKTHQVGMKPANAWGLYDMHGNVYELCWDWYGTYPSTSQTDPIGASSGTLRVGRGGSWDLSAEFLRSAYRDIDFPSRRSGALGFRLVRP